MSTSIEHYWALLDALREQRRLAGWKPEVDRELLERIDEVFEMLDDSAQVEARLGTWRGWPDTYDERSGGVMIEDVDAERGASMSGLRRRIPAASCSRCVASRARATA